VVEGAKHPLDRDLFQRFVEALGDLLTDVEEHEVEKEGGIELELDAIGRGFPEIGKIEYAFSDQEGILPGKELARTPKDVSSSSPKNCS
jgi:hypothetical protein